MIIDSPNYRRVGSLFLCGQRAAVIVARRACVGANGANVAAHADIADDVGAARA